jgi:hypothetical protein
MSDRTIRTLLSITRSKPVERELCCPYCNGEVELVGGEYLCPQGDPFASLAELAVRPIPTTTPSRSS